MESFREYVMAGIQKAGGVNKLARELRTTGGNITRLKDGMGSCGEEIAVRLAEYLSADPERLLIIIQAEKCPEKTRHLWADIYRRVAGATAAIALLALVSPDPSPAGVAQEDGLSARTVCIMSNLLRRWAALAAAFLPPVAPLPA
jgi:hypothetical protein